MTSLVWFRSDLRCADNPALSWACRQGEDVIAVTFICEKQWQLHGLGPRKIQLLKNRMLMLKQELAEKNIPLLILSAATFRDCEATLQTLMTELNINIVSFNNEYEVNERHRDIRFSRWCADQQIAVNRFHDQCVIPPGEVKTGQGTPFKVFTPFKKAWLSHPQLDALYSTLPLPAPDTQKLNKELKQQLAAWQEKEAEADFIPDELWPVSEEAAHSQLNSFIEEQISDYKKLRDLPAVAGTSRLSFFLSLGILSPRQCMHMARSANNGRMAEGNEGITCWISELIWREFYRHLLVAFPDLCKHKAFKPDTENVAWRSSDKDFDAWCEGRTGVPIVDAAMKQLKEEGWMHNRLRMVTAMFLTKNLLIDWRRGEAFFNYWLVDADLAANNGGWQWSASTGADGAPYFRVFNPVSQSERFDSDGEFLARLLPELAKLPAKERHFPADKIRAQLGYPAAMVDLKASRQRAIDAFRQSAELSTS
ncbi:MAG: deoxyribodipyrimidine photo-lyase [Oceanospirillaceae bacterium]|uniref:deoxyribodipyrimidine photo-lyase n=1 Tax=unclassified Thalassolituus TaxID=2624967 RepID=UPI000C5C4EC9|nr:MULTISPECIES: deoxyribodipyrimidine photo-lyase [unclassified Thalassolituus]MAS25269.1 deoxyribodipyrimidine photo-lyase [Oceanospirillaceae bacterium]MAX99071.1 deoxyribodipyrimidine photo-lyase [Oceanospirillaceae bacterium]MBL35389.1 deoxyribodipyrimidine photo-lyase [Oceanospirillaceae bacterium]MBS53334.1 deoxyribodipyrimidine photo-lyase [Oceanospirillaceae bacterium]|tara:strand:+ start:2309 stop:3748 length:1440 start_codon:yes stop_codon:yes gene_type:complete